MKYLAATLLTWLIAFPALAEESEEKSLYTVGACAKSDIADRSLLEAYGETPFALGSAIVEVPKYGTAEGVLIITVNPKTRTYTINIYFEDDDMVCMLTSGENFSPAPSSGTRL